MRRPYSGAVRARGSSPCSCPSEAASCGIAGARASAPRWQTMRTELTDVVLLGDEDPRELEAFLELRREGLHAERLGRPVRPEDQVDPPLAGVELRVHAPLARDVGV